MINVVPRTPSQTRSLLEAYGKPVNDSLIDRALEIWVVVIDGDPVLIGGGIRESLLGSVRCWAVLLNGWRDHRFALLRFVPQLTNLAVLRCHKLEAFAEPGTDAKFLTHCNMQYMGMRDKYARFEA